MTSQGKQEWNKVHASGLLEQEVERVEETCSMVGRSRVGINTCSVMVLESCFGRGKNENDSIVGGSATGDDGVSGSVKHADGGYAIIVCRMQDHYAR